jgi:hypothetical protein
MNEEFLVSAVHYTVLIASLPFVHTARRFNRLDGPANFTDGGLFKSTESNVSHAI